MASRSPTLTAGGSTPSERAPGRITSPAASTLTTAETSSSGPAPPGPLVAPMGPAARKASSIDTAGTTPPDPPARQAEQVRHPALTREGLGSRPRARTVPPSPSFPPEVAGVHVPRWRNVDVAEWRRHRPTKPEGCRFDPCRRRRSRRSSAEESTAFRTRRSHVRIVPARPSPRSSGRREHVPGTDEVVGAMPTEAPESPLPHMPQWSRAALNSRALVELHAR